MREEIGTPAILLRRIASLKKALEEILPLDADESQACSGSADRLTSLEPVIEATDLFMTDEDDDEEAEPVPIRALSIEEDDELPLSDAERAAIQAVIDQDGAAYLRIHGYEDGEGWEPDGFTLVPAREYEKYVRYQRLNRLIEQAYRRALPCDAVRWWGNRVRCAVSGSDCNKRTGATCRAQRKPYRPAGRPWCSQPQPIVEPEIPHFADRTICRFRGSPDGPRPECAECEGLPRHPYTPPLGLGPGDSDERTAPDIMCQHYRPRPLSSREYFAVVGDPNGKQRLRLQLRELGDGMLPLLRHCWFGTGQECYCVDGIPVRPEWFHAIARDVWAYCSRTGHRVPYVPHYSGITIRSYAVRPLSELIGGETQGAPERLAYEQMIAQELAGNFRHRAVAACEERQAYFGSQRPTTTAPDLHLPPDHPSFDRVRAQKRRCQTCYRRLGSPPEMKYGWKACWVAARLMQLAGEDDLAAHPDLAAILNIPCRERQPHDTWWASIQSDQDLAWAALAARDWLSQGRTSYGSIVDAKTRWRKLATAPEAEREAALRQLTYQEEETAAKRRQLEQIWHRLWHAGYRRGYFDRFRMSALEFGYQRYLGSHPAVRAVVKDGVFESLTITAPHLIARSPELAELVRHELADNSGGKRSWITLTDGAIRFDLRLMTRSTYQRTLGEMVDALHPDPDRVAAFRQKFSSRFLHVDLPVRRRMPDTVELIIAGALYGHSIYNWEGSIDEALSRIDQMEQQVDPL